MKLTLSEKPASFKGLSKGILPKEVKLALGETSQHPLIVTILVVFHALWGILTIITGFTLMVVPNTSERFQKIVERLSGSIGIGLIGFVLLLFGIVSLSLSWAFWFLKPWAWTIALILVVFAMIFEVTTSDWADLGLSLFIFLCLFHPTTTTIYEQHILKI
ncbi:MAG: hypothetical protein ACE5R6_08695 [Candidatus Heimdallarchaeota archaeon]